MERRRPASRFFVMMPFLVVSDSDTTSYAVGNPRIAARTR
jgi:hypothetical protein